MEVSHCFYQLPPSDSLSRAVQQFQEVNWISPEIVTRDTWDTSQLMRTYLNLMVYHHFFWGDTPADLIIGIIIRVPREVAFLGGIDLRKVPSELVTTQRP